MRWIPGCLLVLLCLAASPHDVGAKDKPAPKTEKEENEAYPAEFRAKVDAAVDRGVEALLKLQRDDGTWAAQGDLQSYSLGVNALCTLALLVGGVPPKELAVRNAFRAMRKAPLEKTYDVGVLLMALHAKYAGPPKESDVDEYGRSKHRDPCEKAMSKEDKAWMKKCVKFLLDNESGGHWRYPGGGVDLSNTQYALLGLWAASRCGFEIPERVWMDGLTWLLGTQERTGPEVMLQVNEVRGEYRIAWKERARARGFRYRPENPVSGSMTTAGLACIAICQDELWASRRYTPKLRARARRGVRDALAWMQDNFVVEKNPGEPSGGWHFYYLYGMERAGILSRSRFMGKYDWYFQGATYLIDKQGHDGTWTSEHRTLDTCFGILFLRRSTQRPMRSVITPEFG
jgi:hypothetical protein